MVCLENTLKLDSCPHCRIDNPNLVSQHELLTKDSEGFDDRLWRIYVCRRCGGVVTAFAYAVGAPVERTYPGFAGIDEAIPERAHEFLKQAVQSIHSPAGAVMLAASAVDAMLKHKSYDEGSLYTRIDKAAQDHVITEDMAEWAHDVRLDANDQRHADTAADLPSEADAERCVAFAKALGEFMFVLPARVRKGREDAKPPQ